MARRALVLALGLPAAACAAWTLFAGKDLNWDLLNYHYYAPFQLLEGRLRQDYFAASAQSYLNPLGYLPFYGMVAAGWHSVAVSVALALAHSLSLALLFFIAWRLFAHLAPRERAVFSVLATALGAATAVFWATVGTSFLDPLLLPPMLLGLVLLLDRRQFMTAGLLFGLAAALKYSNAIYALAAFPLACLAGWRAAAAYAGGGAVALAAFAGPWLLLMFQHFGNPLFPMSGAGSTRFTPEDLGAALAFPFRMALLDRSLYSEIFAPDLRFAALVLAAMALPFRKGAWHAAERPLLGFTALSAMLWLFTSGNARYGLLVLLLAGVCLARLVERVLPLSLARIGLATLLLVQIAVSVMAAPSRWFIAEPWSRHWFEWRAPERALREPALYLTVETLPMAAVAPFLHADSSFANVRGQHSIAADDPRLLALIERHRGRVRALMRAPEFAEGTFGRVGFRLGDDCFEIPWQRDDADALSRAANRLARTPAPGEPLSLVSCALQPAPRDPAQAQKEREISALFDRIEKACARLFRGHTALTEPYGSGWVRHYVDLDARLEAIGGKLALNRYRSGRMLELGTPAQWACP